MESPGIRDEEEDCRSYSRVSGDSEVEILIVVEMVDAAIEKTVRELALYEGGIMANSVTTFGGNGGTLILLLKSNEKGWRDDWNDI